MFSEKCGDFMVFIISFKTVKTFIIETIFLNVTKIIFLCISFDTPLKHTFASQG